MTVKELRDKLAGLDEKTRVVVDCEDGGEHQLFEIHEVGIQKGAPKRFASGKLGFVFAHNGLVTWLFISVSQE